jgi:hypothetical protein
LNKQERDKELATRLYRPCGIPSYFYFARAFLGPIKALLLWARALRDSVVANNNFKQVLTLDPRKIKNTSATQMRGFKDYYFTSLLRRFATRND